MSLYEGAWKERLVLAGFALAEYLYPLTGPDPSKHDEMRALKIYELLAQNKCLEAVFIVARQFFLKNDIQAGLKWLTYAVSIDDDEWRVQDLKKILGNVQLPSGLF